jgi:hypothetical protein
MTRYDESMRTALFVILALAQIDTQKEPVAAGEITNAKSGEPLRKAFITLQPVGKPATMETSNADGKFRFDDLASGEYQLKVERAGFATRHMKVTLPDRLLKLKLEPLAAIHGRVTDDEGDPLPGVRVRVLRAESLFGTSFFSLVATVNAAPDGAFRADDLAPGRYYLHAESSAMGGTENVRRVARPAFYPGVATPLQATPLEATAGVTLDGADIRLPWKPAYTIRGRLELPPQAGKAEVRLYADLGPFVMEWNHRSVPLNGETFEIRNVPEGDYLVRAIAGEDNRYQARLRLAVSAEVSGLRVKPEVVPTVQVRIERDERGCAAPAWILFPRQPGQVPVGLSDQKLARVIPGEYRVVTSETSTCYASSLEFNGQPVVEDIVVAGDGLWRATLSSGTGELSGTLVADGKLAAGATAILLPERPEARLPMFITAAADNQGRFLFTDLAPGQYRLLARPLWQEPNDLGVLDQWRAKGTLVTVVKETRTRTLAAVE